MPPRTKAQPTPLQMPAARQMALIPGPLDHISPTAGILRLTTARAEYWQYGNEIYRQPHGAAAPLFESYLAPWNGGLARHREQHDAEVAAAIEEATR